MARSQFVSIEVDLRDINDEVIEFVRENLDPEEVFEDAALRVWAKDNGFIEDPSQQ